MSILGLLNLKKRTQLNYKFNGLQGSQVFSDNSIYQRNASVYQGSPILSTSQSVSGGSSLRTDSGSIQIPHFNGMMEGEFTLQFWIKPNLSLLANNAAQCVFVKGFISSFFSIYSHYCEIQRAATGNQGILRFHMYAPVLNISNSTIAININDLNVWNHIAIIYQANGMLRIALNGVFIQSLFFAQSIQTNTSNLFLGDTAYSFFQGGNVQSFKGFIDSFKLDNKDLYKGQPFTPQV